MGAASDHTESLRAVDGNRKLDRTLDDADEGDDNSPTPAPSEDEYYDDDDEDDIDDDQDDDETEDGEALVAKFYRPGRWGREALEEEHSFLLERCLSKP